MSISNRIQAITEHVSNAYDKFEDLGADLTNVNKNINNISTILETMYNEAPKITGEGTDFLLSPTRNGKMIIQPNGNATQEVIPAEAGTTVSGTDIAINDYNDSKESEFETLDANTFQQTYTGKNKWSLNSSYSTSTGNEYVLSDTAIDIPAGTYIISLENTSTNRILFTFKNSSNQGQDVQLNSPYSQTVTFADDKKKVAIYIYNEASTISKIMLRPSDTTDTYEPYVGGTQSPNPNYSQDIQVVKGSNNVKVQNKNFLNVINISTTVAGLTFTGQSDGTLKINGTHNGMTYMLIGTIHLREGNYKLSLSLKSGTGLEPLVMVTCYDNDYHIFNGQLLEEGDYPLYVGVGTVYTFENAIYEVQLEQGSTATSYVPHQEQNFPITLPTGMELCKIENYQDSIIKKSDGWYLRKETGKAVFDGSNDENWYWETVSAGGNNFYINIPDGSGGETIPVLTNYYFHYPNGTLTPDYACRFSTGKNLNCRHQNFNNVSDYKNWLSTHNLVAYYILATPTETKITDTTLVSQLEAIEEAEGYEGTTYITSRQSLPEEYQEVEYIKSTGTQYIDTGLIGTDLTDKEIELTIKNNTTGLNQYNFNGAYLAGKVTQIGTVATSNTTCRCSINFGFTDAVGVDSLDITRFHKLYAKDGLQKVNNVQIGTKSFGSLNEYSFLLFARTNVGGTTTNIEPNAGSSISLFTVKKNGKYIRYLVPCYRNSDNVVGMYDLATNTFYTNSGTGVFLKGNDINNLPIVPSYKYNFVTPAPSPERISDVQVVKGSNNVKIQNKNLFNPDNVENGYINDLNGTVNGDSTSKNTGYMKIKSNTAYYFLPNKSSGNWGAWYDENKNFISGISVNQDGGNITSPSNAKYMRFTVSNANNNPDYATNVLIAESSTATSYVSHQEQNFPITLPEGMELVKIPSTNIKDKFIRKVDGWYIRKEIGKVILDGSENWSQYYYDVRLVNFFAAGLSDTLVINGLCNLCNTNTNTNIKYADDTHTGLQISNLTSFWGLTNGTVAEWQTYLNNNNLILYYPLVTPTDTQITDTTLINQLNNIEKNAKSYQDTTYITSSSNDGIEMIIYASALQGTITEVLEQDY